MLGERGEPGGSVGEDVGGGAAHTEDDERAEDPVLHHAGEQFDAGCGHRLHDRAAQPPAEALTELAEDVPDLRVRGKPGAHRTGGALVDLAGPVRLQRDLSPVPEATQALGGGHGGVLVRGPDRGDQRQAVAVQQVGRAHRVEPAAVRVGREVGVDHGPGGLRVAAGCVGLGGERLGQPPGAVAGVGQGPGGGHRVAVHGQQATVGAGQVADGHLLVEQHGGDRDPAPGRAVEQGAHGVAFGGRGECGGHEADQQRVDGPAAFQRLQAAGQFGRPDGRRGVDGVARRRTVRK